LGLRPLTGAVLASVLLALGLGAGALLTGGDDGGAMRTIAATIDPAQAPTGSAEMRLASSTGAKLVVAGMPEPPKGRIYQVWLDYPNDAKPPLATDAFFSVNRRGTASVDVPGDLKGVSQVLVTSEPMGGSTVPSGPPLITVKTVA
jgi:hypothetical protein